MGTLLLHYFLSNGLHQSFTYVGQTWAQAQTLITAAAGAGTITRMEWKKF